MSNNKKPRKAYRPRAICADTMGLAKHFAAKPAEQDLGEVLGALRQALKALREGMATEDQWSVVAGSVSVAQAIERGGIVRGLQEHITTTERVIQTIFDRATRTGTWCRTALWFNERDELANFMDIHAFQVNQLGRAEFLKAIEVARKNILAKGQRCTLTLTHTHQPERMAA